MTIFVFNEQQLHKLMASLDNLTAAIAANTAANQNIPQTGGEPGANATQTQAAADAITANTAANTAKLTPPVVTPPTP